jgi:hypothetical protein
MQVYLSSFFKAKELPVGVEAWSAAVYQPKGMTFPKAGWADIREDKTGAWIRPRVFEGYSNPPKAYRDYLIEQYRGRIEEFNIWRYSQEGDAALLCWCPYDKAAKRQLDEWGSFICHTGVIAEFLIEQGVPVWLDSDRSKMMVLSQRLSK